MRLKEIEEIQNDIGRISTLNDRLTLEAQKGIKHADKIIRNSKISLICGLVTGIALAILLHPFAFATMLPLGAYALFSWDHAASLKNLCSKTIDYSGKYLAIGRKIAEMKNFQEQGLKKITPSDQEGIQTNLIAIKELNESFDRFLREEHIKPSEQFDEMKRGCLACGKAFDAFVPLQAEPLKNADQIRAQNLLFFQQLDSMVDAIFSMLTDKQSHLEFRLVAEKITL